MAHHKKKNSDDFNNRSKSNLDHMFEEYENGTRSIFKSLNRKSYEEESDSNAESDNEDVKPDITIKLSRNGKDGLDLAEMGLPSPENILREQEENLAVLRKNIKKGTADDKIELGEALLEKIQILMEWMEEDEGIHLQKEINRTFTELNKLVEDTKLETDNPRLTRLAVDSALQWGIFFFDQSDPSLALKSYSICMIEQNKLHRTQGGLEEEMAGVRLNIATCYDMLGDLEHVESYAREAIELFRIAKAHPDPNQGQFDKNNLDYYLAKTMLLLAHQFVTQNRYKDARPYLNESLELLENIVAQFDENTTIEDSPSMTIYDDIYHARELLFEIDADNMTPNEQRIALKKLSDAIVKAIHPIGDEETIEEYINIQRTRSEIELGEHQFEAAIAIARETFGIIDTDSHMFKRPDMRALLIVLYQIYAISYTACGRHKLAMRYIRIAITLLRRNIRQIKKKMIKTNDKGRHLSEDNSIPFVLEFLRLRMKRILSWVQLLNMLVQKASLLHQHGIIISPESQEKIECFQDLIDYWVTNMKDETLTASYSPTLTSYKNYLKLRNKGTKG